MRIVALDNPLRYLTINKDGAICIWSSNMVLEKVTFTDPELEDVNGQKRRFKVNRFCELPVNSWEGLLIFWPPALTLQ